MMLLNFLHVMPLKQKQHEGLCVCVSGVTMFKCDSDFKKSFYFRVSLFTMTRSYISLNVCVCVCE